ncbi:MAG TPA: glycosyltransferase [Candidatus Gracilibacteria bacterium]
MRFHPDILGYLEQEVQPQMKQLEDGAPQGSIIICAHNEQDVLPATLAAVAQVSTRVSLEVIGVDNASTDATGEIFAAAGVHCIDQPRKGLSYARAAGLEAARSELIFQTDADTIVPTTWIEAHRRHYQEDDGLVGVSGGIKYLGAHWSHCLYGLGEKAFTEFYALVKKRRKKCIGGANLSFKRQSVLDTGGIRLGADLGEDLILFSQIAEQGRTLIDTGPEITVGTDGRRFDTAPKMAAHTKARVMNIMRRLRYSGIFPEGQNFNDVRG